MRLGLLACCVVLVAAEDGKRVSHAEAGRIWRETTEKGVLPDDVQYVRDHLGYTDAVVSYFRDGPGIFNVAPDAAWAAYDRIYFAAVRDLGFEVLQCETWAMGALLDTGLPENAQLAEKLARERLASRLVQGARIIIAELTGREVAPAKVEYYSAGLLLALHALEQHQAWRRSPADSLPRFPGNAENQDEILNAGIDALRTYLRSIRKIPDEPAP